MEWRNMLDDPICPSCGEDRLFGTGSGEYDYSLECDTCHFILDTERFTRALERGY